MIQATVQLPLPAGASVALHRRIGVAQSRVAVRWRPTHRLEWAGPTGGGVTSVMAIASATNVVELWTRQEATLGGPAAWSYHPLAPEGQQLLYQGVVWTGEVSMRALGTAPGRGSRRKRA